MYLSKTDYIQALGCQKALWLKKNRKDLISELDMSGRNSFKIGNQLRELAQAYFSGGVLIPSETGDISKRAKCTWDLSVHHDVLFGATALLFNNAFCRVDVLRRNGSGWDIIEIKNSTRVKKEHLSDLAYQKYVFDNAGYIIQRCFVLHVNSNYMRQGDLDVSQMFTLVDVTNGVWEQSTLVAFYVERFLEKQQQKEEPIHFLKTACRKCPFFEYCGKDVPAYSVFNLLQAEQADAFYAQTGCWDVSAVPEDLCATQKQRIDRAAFITNQEHVEKDNIQNWLSLLQYPLYYLDFETIQSPIPLFENSSLYEQIPFQFSLHIQDEINGSVRHVGFLHQERTDPRRAVAENLVNVCGKSGSVITYNAQFEKGRIQELSHLFPDLRDELLEINQRVVDQLIPFQGRYLYSPKQKSSASIKYVLPAFSNLSYSGMEISNGGQAMLRYLDFMMGKLSLEEEKILFNGLEKYCTQDTYAMVVLMAELYKRVA